MGCVGNGSRHRNYLTKCGSKRGRKDPNSQLCWGSMCMCQCNTPLEEGMHAHEQLIPAASESMTLCVVEAFSTCMPSVGALRMCKEYNSMTC